MCGIFAIAGATDAPEKTLTGLKTLEYRGYDSWGVAWKRSSQATDNRLQVEKHVGKIGDAKLSYELSTVACSLAIGHTRWATHGGVTELNAHPHLDCTGRFAIVHNGIVENYAALKEDLLSKGHTFRSETDSEVIAHLIEEEVSGTGYQVQEHIRKVFLRLKGLNAIVVLDLDTETIIACKNGSPLVIGQTRVLASDAIALIPHTDTVHYMDDGEMVVIRATEMILYDLLSGDKKQFEWKKIEHQNGSTTIGSYAHFMLKEIHEQQSLVHRLQATDYRLDISAKRIFFVGCGSAYIASLYGQYLCLEKGVDARAVVGSEFGSVLTLLTASDLVIFLSQSGETIDLVEHAKVLKKKHIPMIGLINREGSTLGRLCDHVIPLSAGPEQSVCATKSWFAKVSLLSKLWGKNDLSPAIEAVEHTQTPAYEQTVIAPVVKKIKDAKSIFLLGRGKNMVLALEGAMKIKEITYIHAEAAPGGELKHGSIALIEPGTPVIVIAPHDATYDSMISNAMEVKARGAVVIGISDTPHPCFDLYVPVISPEETWILPATVAIQLLAYHTAVALRRDPDKPRNLAKSVTVK